MERRIVACTALIESNGESGERLSRAYDNRGVAFAHERQFERAKADFNEAIRLSAANFVAHFNRGNLFLETGQIDQAIADFSEAIRIEPVDGTAYGARGVAFLRKGSLEKSLLDLNVAVGLRPNDAEAVNNRGTAYYRSGLQRLADRRSAGVEHRGQLPLGRQLGSPLEPPVADEESNLVEYFVGFARTLQ